MVRVYFVVFFLFFLVSIGFHVQVQSRHKRFVYRKRYSSTIHWTFSHFSFLYLLLSYFSSRFFILVFECSLWVENIFLQSKLVLECPTWLASQKTIFLPRHPKKLLLSKLIQVLFPWSSTLAFKRCRYSDSTSAGLLYLRFVKSFCRIVTQQDHHPENRTEIEHSDVLKVLRRASGPWECGIFRIPRDYSNSTSSFCRQTFCKLHLRNSSYVKSVSFIPTW